MPKVKIKRKEYLLTGFSDYVRCEMKHKHITQSAMAEHLGITQANLSKMLSGNHYTLEQMLVIFEKLDTPAEQIGRLLKL